MVSALGFFKDAGKSVIWFFVCVCVDGGNVDGFPVTPDHGTVSALSTTPSSLVSYTLFSMSPLPEAAILSSTYFFVAACMLAVGAACSVRKPVNVPPASGSLLLTVFQVVTIAAVMPSSAFLLEWLCLAVTAAARFASVCV